MAKYIDKSALVAEIERRIKERDIQMKQGCWVSSTYMYEDLLDFLDTIEVKEGDLEKEFDNYAKDILACDVQFEPFTHLYNCAKYFYELGIKSQTKDITEALRTEYEKGRADVIADTLSWLENCWPKYCSNQTIIKGFKEAIKGE